ncbi:Ig-like domain-containing protein [Solicola gregarius]|uniref:Ig-like domain-containing protein n=1 Tax=Solicola gregarius TaxID=2908642 RepID=A0AA46TKD2_9ACTN|nr:Ig-like domain-containing protein [Solicola gregarius]UYM06891.1 Ig-like domain-containing protein [Solicola gregarius]
MDGIRYRRPATRVVGTGCAAVMMASSVLLIAPPSGAAPDDTIVIEIAPDETNYAGWHQGYADAEYSFGLTEDGLSMTGKSQVINGYDDNDSDLSGEDNVDLRAALRAAAYTLESGEARFQVALFFDNTDNGTVDPVFTTLRPQDPATEGRNEVGTSDAWVSSKAIDADHGANAPAPLGDLLEAIGDQRKTIGYGVLTTPGSEAVVDSIDWDGTTYAFRSAGAEESMVADRDIGFDETPYAGWHQGVENAGEPGEHEVTEDGLVMTGRSQVIKGYDDNTLDVDSRNVHLPSVLENASYTLAEGDAWFQVAAFFTAAGQTDPAFTTLRPAQPAQAGDEQAISLDDEWIASRAIGAVPANTPTPLRDLVGAMTEYKVIGFGVYTEGDGATVSDLTWDHTKYTFADTRPTGTEQVFFADIAPAETDATYGHWHQGVESGAYEVNADGLFLDGRSQVINGYDEGEQPNAGLDRALSEASYTVESGDAWFQVAVGWAEGGFATLRPAGPATAGENEISLDQEWISSNAIGDVPANAAMPLADLVNAIQSQSGSHVLAFGVYSDTAGDATVSSIEWDGTTYEFVNRAPKATRESLETKARKSVTMRFDKTDRDGNPVTYEVDNPVNGKVELDGRKATYTPDRNFTGKDRFRYTVIDPYGESDSGYVVVQVEKLNAKVTGIRVTPKKVTPAKRVSVTVRVVSGGEPASGKVAIRAKRVLGQKKLKDGKATIKIGKLKRGKHTLTARYLGTKVSAKASRQFTIKVVRR